MPTVSLICNECHAENSSESKVCSFCGTPLTKQAGVKTVTNQPRKPPSAQRFYATARGALLISLCIFVVYMALGLVAKSLGRWGTKPEDIQAQASFYYMFGNLSVSVLGIYWFWFFFLRERSAKRQVKKCKQSVPVEEGVVFKKL